ncbi:helix-turn-helix transcriptional regulator [Vibrio sonorensis]|uniref:helix-turn-helix transcriptional regulator n=1 Tax=Vibrio sonorensis TaxID=1004316 RepID=UPI0008D94F63|nr:AlpA family phage regulatory protein [Vibrio sonorensis]
MTEVQKASLKLITYSEMEQLISRNYRTIWRMVKDGRFPHPVKVNGRTIGWKPSDFEAWLDANQGA